MKELGPRILLTTDAVGGVWVFATTLAAGLAARGSRVILVVQGPAPRAEQFVSARAMPGVETVVTDFALEWMDPEGKDFARAAAGLTALARRYRPDIIHLNSYREAAADWPAPVVVTAHSCVRSWWRACRGEEPAEPRWAPYLVNVETGLAMADCWTAPTQWFRDEIQALYAPPSPGRVVRNGIDIDLQLAPKDAFILAAGRLWDEAKNIGALATVAAGLPWPVLVAGPECLGTNEIAAASSLKMLGTLARPDLLALMRRAGVFVVPALYEPFGLAALEAAAAGCALVLADIPSLRELWMGAAVFFDPRDPTDLARALNSVCDDPALRRRLQRAAMHRTRRYRAAAMVERFAELYRTLLTRQTRIRWPLLLAGTRS
ncbi:MAG: glycosyltransferase family 4 protein [Xanthobacteraceae bacterium]|nr:glycosyltransferase family 4 protein [Xanthobacteraceae bacterium]MBV9627772.1 glycosyltransferase family 4 protein [Xanthobacteraceae bacterium]